MLNSTIYEEKYVLPGGGGNNAFVKPQTKLDVMPTPLQPQAGVTLAPQPAFAQPQIDSMPQQAQKDAPMQPTARPNLFAKQAEPATFSNLNIPSQGAKTYTPSASNPTQSVYDYMLQPSEEEKKLYKDNESKKRLLLLGDALRHLGNLYFTTKGATPQQFTSPVVQQEQQYQQKRQELRAQRAAALKNAMEQAKLQAEQNYKNSMLGMRAAELERGLANDEWNRQWNQFKWAGDQANKDREFGFKKANADRTFAETVRSNKANEGLRRQSNSIASMNAKTARDRLNFEKGEGGGLPKGKIYLPHANMSMGGTTKWIIDEKTYKNAIPAMYDAMRKAGLIKPLSNSSFYNDTGEERYVKMKQLVEGQYTSDIYNDWMQRLGATTNDGYKETTQDRIVRQSGGGIHPRKKSTK